jgi:isocitrate dehydrogenase
MRQPSTPNNNGTSQRTRTRGAIRTHLGRKRTGPRRRDGSFAAMEGATNDRRRDEDMFDRLLGQVGSAFEGAGEKTASAFEAALDAACNTLVAAGEFTAENAGRLREFLRRDMLHRDHPGLTFRTGDITSAGTLSCDNCGWTIVTSRTSMLPACPQCGEASFRKTA